MQALNCRSNRHPGSDILVRRTTARRFQLSIFKEFQRMCCASMNPRDVIASTRVPQNRRVKLSSAKFNKVRSKKARNAAGRGKTSRRCTIRGSNTGSQGSCSLVWGSVGQNLGLRVEGIICLKQKPQPESLGCRA